MAPRASVPTSPADDRRAHVIACALARRARPAIVAYALLAVLIPGTTAYADRHPGKVVLFVGAASLLTVLRLHLVQRSPDVAAAARWTRRFRELALAAASLWGIGLGLALVDGGAAKDALVFVIATAAMAMGAVTTFAADAFLQRLYPALLVGPCIVALSVTTHRGTGTPALVLAATIFLGFAVFVARILNADFLAALGSADLLEQRAAELDRARQRAEAADQAKTRLLVDLQRSYELAQAASQAKSDFLANVSHEIRTPLTAILGYADLLSATGAMDDAERRGHAAVVRRNGEQLLGLLSDVLDLSKIEAGQMSVEPSATRLDEILNDVVSLMKARAAEKSLTLTLAFLTPVPETVVTDALRLRQILLNLVSNAIKFTDAGSVRLEVAGHAADGHQRLRFAVVDTGIGLSASQASRLFQPFAQVDASATRRFGGTGLGLAISRRFARMLGGDVTVSSARGKGSTFTVEIDGGSAAGDEKIIEGLAPPSESVRRPVVAADLEGLRVLLAEDSPDNQRLLSLHLRRAGAEVDVASNGGEARDKALQAEREGRPYLVVLMDMQMPGVDGYAGTAALRQAGYTRRIVALTANAMKGDRERCVAAGCDDYLTKPIGKKDLIAAVAQAKTVAATPTSAPEQGFGEETLNDLRQFYLTQLHANLGVLRDAAARDDARRVSEIAHQLRGSASVYGYADISRSAREVEATLRGGARTSEAGPELDALLNACRQAIGPVASTSP